MLDAMDINWGVTDRAFMFCMMSVDPMVEDLGVLEVLGRMEEEDVLSVDSTDGDSASDAMS